MRKSRRPTTKRRSGELRRVCVPYYFPRISLSLQCAKLASSFPKLPGAAQPNCGCNQADSLAYPVIAHTRSGVKPVERRAPPSGRLRPCSHDLICSTVTAERASEILLRKSGLLADNPRPTRARGLISGARRLFVPNLAHARPTTAAFESPPLRNGSLPPALARGEPRPRQLNGIAAAQRKRPAWSEE